MIRAITVGLALLIILGAVGSSDYGEQVRQDEYYCSMVKSGAWPDYKNLECEGNNESD